MSLSVEIKNIFEDTFQIPFLVRPTSRGYEVGPEIDGRFAFHLSISIPTEARLTIDFCIEPFGQSVLATMSESSLEKRAKACFYLEQLSLKHAKIVLLADGNPLSISMPESWPTKWDSFSLKVGRFPFLADENTDLIRASIPSSVLTMASVLALFTTSTGFGADGPDVVSEIGPKTEGNVFEVKLNRYERNPINRALCLMKKGYKCMVCGFDFEIKYGEIGKNYIQVHHVVPVSCLGPNYLIDPEKDLVPVCANCHAMLHRRTPPYSVDELKNMIKG